MVDYPTVRVDALPDAPAPSRHKKEVDEAVGATEFGFNVYIAEPGERLPWGYHYHPDHEELFYVVAGRLVLDTPGEKIVVEEGEAVFVPAGAKNRARVVGDERARVIAVGAPKDADSAVIEDECPACGAPTGRTAEADGDAYILACSACGEPVDRIVAGPDDGGE